MHVSIMAGTRKVQYNTLSQYYCSKKSLVPIIQIEEEDLLGQLASEESLLLLPSLVCFAIHNQDPSTIQPLVEPGITKLASVVGTRVQGSFSHWRKKSQTV